MTEPAARDHDARAPDPGADPYAGRLGRVINAGGGVFALLLVLSAGILIFEIVMRYVFNAPTIWAHETVIFLSGASFVYGGLYAVVRNQHIRIVLIYNQLPPRIRRRVDVAISFFSFLATAFFAWAAWQGVKRAVWNPAGDIRLERSGSAWNPPFPAFLKTFLLLMLLVMAVQFLILTVNHLRGRER